MYQRKITFTVQLCASNIQEICKFIYQRKKSVILLCRDFVKKIPYPQPNNV